MDIHWAAYYTYLKFERNYTENTAQSYLRDAGKLEQYASACRPAGEVPEDRLCMDALSQMEIEAFLATLHDVGISPESQARILAGVKSYYRFLCLEGVRSDDPTELIQAPKKRKALPAVLSLDEVNRIVAAPDVSTPLGQRDRAILETLYSCGLRVSELIALRHSRVLASEGYLLVEGKGRKERIVPIAASALSEIRAFDACRSELDIQPGHEDYVFVNSRGRRMTRQAVYDIVKRYCAEAGVRKVVSPHTFRHTFATHLLEGGANLRAIQMMLGHEQLSTTQLYMHVDTQHLREEVLMHHPRNVASPPRAPRE